MKTLKEFFKNRHNRIEDKAVKSTMQFVIDLFRKINSFDKDNIVTDRSINGIKFLMTTTEDRFGIILDSENKKITVFSTNNDISQDSDPEVHNYQYKLLSSRGIHLFREVDGKMIDQGHAYYILRDMMLKMLLKYINKYKDPDNVI